MDLNEKNEVAERMSGTAFDAHKAFVAHAFALREENAKLVDGLFEAGVEAFWNQAEMNRRTTSSILDHTRRHQELSWHMASESMEAYVACLRAFSPQRRRPEADSAEAKPPTTPIEDYDKLSFEEIAARLMEPEALETG